MKSANEYDLVVCGGGFKGAMCAIHGAKSGKKVGLVESSPRLGGVLNSIPWKKYHLDIGCHLFDNSTQEITQLLFDIHPDVHPVNVSYQSIMAPGKVSSDMAQPDLTLLNTDQEKIRRILERIALEKPSAPTTNYLQYLQQRFGEYITHFLVSCVKKKVGIDPALLCASASGVVLMDRLRLLNDVVAAQLKKEPALDERLAISSTQDPMHHYPDAARFYGHRNFYPSKQGMGGFCRSLESYIKDLNVDIIYEDKVCEVQPNQITLSSGKTLLSEKFIWSNELSSFEELTQQTTKLKELSHPVAAVLVYFEVPMESVSNTTYLHDYRQETPSFRLSTSGKYGNQNAQGNTFVCCETFTHANSQYWDVNESNYQEVWAQATELGIVNTAKPIDVKVIKHPSAYFLPKVGSLNLRNQLEKRFSQNHPDWLFFKTPGFSKQSIYLQAQKIVSGS